MGVLEPLGKNEGIYYIDDMLNRIMEIITCKICSESGHPSTKCPELNTSLYGKFGEGAQKGSHSHEDDALKVLFIQVLKYWRPL